MSYQNYLAACELIAKYPHLKHFAGSQTENAVRRAEDLLAVKFPPIYRRFLLEYGGGYFGAFEVEGIGWQPSDGSFVSNAIGLTLEFRRKYALPHHLIMLSDEDIFHYYLRLDPDDATKEEVVMIDGWDFEDDEIEVSDATFGDFFLRNVLAAIAFLEDKSPGRRARGIDTTQSILDRLTEIGGFF
jgi:hypothetical protein